MHEQVQRVPTVAYGRRLRVTAVVAATVALGLVAWLVFGGDDNSKTTSQVAASAASVTELQGLPSKVGHDVYWAGKQPGFTYELTKTSQGNIFVRYLPQGVQPGDPRPNFLTVGTYPRPGAYTVLQKFSSRPRSSTRHLSGGGIAVYAKDTPNSVYVAYPGSDLQVEVFDPSAGRALEFASSGRIQPIR
jgi:hypothetical protein